MSELPHLVPATTRGFCEPAKRISFAFGRRFFLLLLVGLVWLGPAWHEFPYLYALSLLDVAVLYAWVWKLRRLPRPTQLDVSRVWSQPIQLDVNARVAL